MANNKITLTIEAERGRRNIPFGTFLAELQAVHEALTHADRLRAGAPTIAYEVADLSKNSPATVTLQAKPINRKVDFRREVLSTFFSGLQEIQERGHAPSYFDRPMLEKVKQLTTQAGKRRLKTTITASGYEIALNRRLDEKIEKS
jgi:hypothetical protein